MPQKHNEIFPSQSSCLKFNDSVVIKSYDSQKQQMIVIGDMKFSNSINCIAQESKSIDNPNALYKKCLFTIKNPRNLQYVSNNEEFVLYGQRILLKHLSSAKLLQMNLDQPADEKGAFSVQLASQKSQYTMLRILPGSTSKKIGDKILYQDQVMFQDDSTRQYYIKIETKVDLNMNNTGALLDVNAGDSGDQFRIEKYNHDSSSSYNGDIVILQHLETQDLLSITEKKLLQCIQTRPCLINNSIDESRPGTDSFSLKQLDINKFQASENFDLILENITKDKENQQIPTEQWNFVMENFGKS